MGAEAVATTDASLEVAQLAFEEAIYASSARKSNAISTSADLITPCDALVARKVAPTEDFLPRRHSYVGSHVEVRGDGWGCGSERYVGIVTKEDPATFTVVPAGRLPWNNKCVLRECCNIIRLEPALHVASESKTNSVGSESEKP